VKLGLGTRNHRLGWAEGFGLGQGFTRSKEDEGVVGLAGIKKEEKGAED
jgi:hypothetical protein